jgi:hypothetical protein
MQARSNRQEIFLRVIGYPFEKVTYAAKHPVLRRQRGIAKIMPRRVLLELSWNCEELF